MTQREDNFVSVSISGITGLWSDRQQFKQGVIAHIYHALFRTFYVPVSGALQVL